MRYLDPRSLVRMVESAPPDVVSRGVGWYREESEYLADVASELGLRHTTACGAASHLSPAVRWETARADVARLYQHGEAATYPAFRDKALAVLTADDWDAAPYGQKTDAFRQNLARPTESGPVTLDRLHARLHEVPNWTPKRYAEVSSTYRRAAKRLGILPHELQAVVWLLIREGYVG